MKLLFVIPEYPPCSGGGIATFYQNLLPQLAQQGHQVHVLAGSAFTSAHPGYERDGVTVEFLDPTRIAANHRRFDRYRATPELQRHLTAAWAAWEQVRGGQGYDLVETTDWGLLFAPWVAAADSPPTVVQLHASIGQIDACDPRADLGLQSTLVRLLEMELLAIADELQTLSHANAQAWQRLIGRQVHCIPPALSVETVGRSLQNEHAVPSIDPGKSSAGLVVGRIQYWKGPTVLCEALQQLGDAAPVIDWIGRDTVFGKSGQSMAAYLKENYPGIWGNKVCPVGTRSPQDTARLQAQAQFLLVPSVWDVFNYTCIEGMAQAQTVLCSEGAGAAEWICDRHNGFTFGADDPVVLAEVLRAAMALSPEQQQHMGRAAQETAKTEFCPMAIAQQRLYSYQQRIAQGKFSSAANAWLLDAIMPQKPLMKPLTFLDHLPLRELVDYLLQRSVNKLFPSK